MRFCSLKECVLSMLSALLFSSGIALAQDAPQLETLSNVEQQARLAGQQLALEQATYLPELRFPAPEGNANISLVTMYSAQQGSWSFEPFVHNGLFRAIAGYQSHHPQAVVIQGGSITLQQLYTQLNDEKILSRYKEGYLLRYPLMIEPGAALLVHNTELYLYNYSGTALINKGFLSLNNARLQSHNDNRPQATDRPYRPFLINWAGSSLRIEASHLTELGYNENLSRGVTSARSVHQPSSVSPARVLVSNSDFKDMSVGLELSHALARANKNTFTHMQQYAMDFSNSRVQVENNRIDTVRNLSGIRLLGDVKGRIEGNKVLRANKSAIEVTDFSGELIVRNNQLGANAGYGVLLRNASTRSQLLLADNLIGNTSLTAIDGANLNQLSLTGNLITGTPEYAISIRNSRPAEGPLIVISNHLWGIGKAMLRVQGVHSVVLGENKFQANPLLQNIMIGDLLRYQAPLLEMMLGQERTVALKMAKVSLLPADG